MLENEENMCMFYASDYHFEMIILPYLNKKLNENNNIIIFTENDLDNTVNTLISNINLNEKNKEKLLKIDWKNNDLNKFKILKEFENNSEQTHIFIKGTEHYIENIKSHISTNLNNKNISIIDCYSIDEIGGNITNIANNYENVLNTNGISKIGNQ